MLFQLDLRIAIEAATNNNNKLVVYAIHLLIEIACIGYGIQSMLVDIFNEIH